MDRPQPIEPEADAAHGRRAVDLDALGFGFDEGDSWFDQVRAAEAPPAPQALGSIGPYELLEEVSRGGQGVVFRARQPNTKRPIALKRLLAGSFATTSMRRRFEREVEAAAALNHPGIVTAYGMELVDGLPLFAMEWIDGVPVTQWASASEAADERDIDAIIAVFLGICDAVEHAHSRGVLHRDLKPSNILVDDVGQPHVLDFGLAKRFSEGDSIEDLTGSAGFLGTPAYASPEQFHLGATGGGLDVRSDVYSLGVIFFEMLTGASPYPKTECVTDLVRAVESSDPPRPSSIVPRIGRELDTVVLKAMAKDRAERYLSVDALAADVRRYLKGEPVLAIEPSSLYLFKKLALRNRLAFAFAATVLALVLGFGINAMRLLGDLEDKNIALEEERDAALEAKGVASAERDSALEARKEAFRKANMAIEAADPLELFLLQYADVRTGKAGAAAALATGSEPLGAAGPTPPAQEAAVDRTPTPVPTMTYPGTPNPHFDPAAFVPRGGEEASEATVEIPRTDSPH